MAADPTQQVVLAAIDDIQRYTGSCIMVAAVQLKSCNGPFWFPAIAACRNRSNQRPITSHSELMQPISVSPNASPYIRKIGGYKLVFPKTLGRGGYGWSF